MLRLAERWETAAEQETASEQRALVLRRMASELREALELAGVMDAQERVLVAPGIGTMWRVLLDGEPVFESDDSGACLEVAKRLRRVAQVEAAEGRGEDA